MTPAGNEINNLFLDYFFTSDAINEHIRVLYLVKIKRARNFYLFDKETKLRKTKPNLFLYSVFM